MSWWPGDGDARDLVGPNGGALANGTGFAQGRVADGFDFDGADDWVQAPAAGLPTGRGARTVELWARIDRFGSGESFGRRSASPRRHSALVTAQPHEPRNDPLVRRHSSPLPPNDHGPTVVR